MAIYGRGQMLGSGINPESFKQDYSGFTRAAEMQAQTIANLGQNIAGAIKDTTEAKKKQRKVDAYNKAAAKSIEAAITLGKTYEIKGVDKALKPFLDSYNDPNLSPIEKAALLDEGKAMIPNIFGRYDKSQAIAIDKAQIDAAGRGSGRAANLQLGEIVETINGKQYKVPVTFDPDTGTTRRLDGSIIGESARQSKMIQDALDQSATTPLGSPQQTANAINNAVPLPDVYIPDGSPGSLPPVGTPARTTTGDEPSLLPPVEDSITNAENLNAQPYGNAAPVQPAAQQQTGMRLPPGASPVKVDTEEGIEMSQSQISELIQQGYKLSGVPLANGGMRVTNAQSIVPGKGQEVTINKDGTVTVKDISLNGKAQAVAAAREQMKQESTQLSQVNTESAFNLLDSVGSNNPLAAAGNAVIATILPASDRGLLQSYLTRVNEENSFKKMSQLRASSPTGGAAGSMTVQEWPRFEGRYGRLDINSQKDDLARNLSANMLNSFEAANGTPDDVMKLLDEKKIDQKTYDDYVANYLQNRKIARVGSEGLPGDALKWTKLNDNLLSRSTNFNEAVTTPNATSELDRILKEHTANPK